jgi:septum formation protein
MTKIKQNIAIILASTSKVRKEILHDLGLKFKDVSPDFDEESAKDEISHLSIPDQALFLAQQKALSISVKVKDALVIGSDQICQIDNETISKPKNKEEAIAQLKSLNGKIHFQNNGVAVFQNGKEIYCKIQIAKIKMRVLTYEEIVSYVNLDNPVGCAGSYKIESFGRHLFKEIEGDIACISGIAVQPLLSFLHQNQFIEI